MVKILKKICKSIHDIESPDKNISKMYKIHKYWSRKPWNTVEKYILKYSKIGDLVFDPFCGSGCMGSEAIINGRNFLGQDLNPVSIFISECTAMNEIDFEKLSEDFNKVSELCKNKILKLYKSDRKCVMCGENVYYYQLNNGKKHSNSLEGIFICDKCGTKTKTLKITDKEKDIIKFVNGKKILSWYPQRQFPEKFYKDRFSYKGIHCVADMYTKRNLHALSILLDSIKKAELEYPELMYLAFSNTVLHVSKLKGENVRPLSVNNYWVPDDSIEENVWFRFDNRFKVIFEGKKNQQERIKHKENNYGKYKFAIKSALKNMGKEKYDYIFTDPPYGDAIQYSELSYIYNAWLDENYDNTEEVIINPKQNKSEVEYNKFINKSLDNIYSALKNNKYFTLCFQNKNFSIWKNIIKHAKDLGFQLEDVGIHDLFGNSYNYNWAKFSPKSDIYVTFKKSKVMKNNYYSRKNSLVEIANECVDYLTTNDICFDNNKLYDVIIAYIIWDMFLNNVDNDYSDFNIKKLLTDFK